ncbi:tryptophan synthase subunit alpha [compost metagenome]
MDLQSPLAIGFGISNRQSFEQATTYATGAIIGTAFVKLLGKENYLDEIPSFINSIKG